MCLAHSVASNEANYGSQKEKSLSPAGCGLCGQPLGPDVKGIPHKPPLWG
jgi:hypothetical protein